MLTRICLGLTLFSACAVATEQPTAADTAEALRHIVLDPQQTYRIRDVRIRRGDVNIYLNEGVLSFASAVAGRTVAAVFTTYGVDAGDAEILLMPPQPAERASLASFTKLPNLDEHFSTAVLFFSDTTKQDILKQLSGQGLEKAPDAAAELGSKLNGVIQRAGSEISTRTVESLLDQHRVENGFFFSFILGRDLGSFDLLYEPDSFEPVTVGTASGEKASTDKAPAGVFQVWTAYRPRLAPEYRLPQPTISHYRLRTVINEDLSLESTADFELVASADHGRLIPLSMTRHLKVDSAKIDGNPVEVYQNYSPDFSGIETDSEFLLVNGQPLTPGRQYHVQIRYSGSVIRRISETSYFVSERNVWYPHTTPMLTNFDLTFQCPERFGLVSTGELLSDTISAGIRTVHRTTQVPEQLAGFNLGEYKSLALERGPYRIECYADRAVAKDMNGIPEACERILAHYSARWGELPIHTVAVTPIAGYFGQGFPGLIYLSSTAYLSQKDRPSEVRNERADAFFSQLLIPHEIAHQWWGNVVSSANYRADWLMESMANYSALLYLEEKDGSSAMRPFLAQFRKDLAEEVDGKRVESLGPVDFGLRLLEVNGENVWHAIVYEKGTYILHMLRERMGETGFRGMQMALLRQYAGKPITNEEFRKVASAFIPATQPDRDLNTFFDTWVYGTGLPSMHLDRANSSLEVGSVDEAFTADVPLRCKSKLGETVKWIRVVAGSNPIPGGTDRRMCRLPSASEYLYTE